MFLTSEISSGIIAGMPVKSAIGVGGAAANGLAERAILNW